MSDKIEYYEREGAIFRKQPGHSVEIHHYSGWSEYTGDLFKLKHTSSIISEKEANEYIAEDDAYHQKRNSKKEAVAA